MKAKRNLGGKEVYQIFQSIHEPSISRSKYLSTTDRISVAKEIMEDMKSNSLSVDISYIDGRDCSLNFCCILTYLDAMMRILMGTSVPMCHYISHKWRR